ncbi:hypothetical protein [Tautonia rosea]|uniref:hypothetical protein n=1 Tax=Tautonia rosea TaxID=2728037 RepID=UPI0019D16E2D|nr:hypothetical protein [Tautonia rosea]
MRKDQDTAPPEDELRPEYGPKDLKQGVRGKYLKRYQAGTNLALLSAEVRTALSTDEAVNQALRSLWKNGPHGESPVTDLVRLIVIVVRTKPGRSG